MSNGTPESTPRPENPVDAAIADTFPASDPPSMSQPVTAAPAVPEHPEPSAQPRLVYRVVTRDSVDEAFGVEGNRKGGRWTSPGTAVVYTSSSAAGAVLEFLAHLEGQSPDQLVIVTAQLPGGVVETAETLPPQWRERPYREDVRAFGDGWVAHRRSLALEVPSVLCAVERNVLINPQHPDAAQLKIRAVDPFHIDPRLRF
ncbi:MAG TPA: RES family NAD+ phosphorylase [Lysobacter sp.]